MHWILDVSMREDACQIYRENAAENLARLRLMALNVLKAEPTKISEANEAEALHDKTRLLGASLVSWF